MNPRPAVPDATAGDAAAVAVRGLSITMPVVQLATRDPARIGAALATKVAQAGDLFRDAPVVIDLRELGEGPVDFEAVVAALAAQGLRPVAVGNASGDQAAAARAAGLAVLAGGRMRALEPAAAEPPADEPAAARLVTQPVRAGQRVYAARGDLVVIGQVNTGAEVLAAGNVHVYGPLRGRAVAGVRGDATARILTTCFAPQLVAIAGVYRTLEDGGPVEVRERPAQVSLAGDRLIIEPLAAGAEAGRRPA